MEAEDHPTKGYKREPGWHALYKKEAPHLKERGRVWCRVELEGCEERMRPVSQGGRWILAKRMKVLEILC